MKKKVILAVSLILILTLSTPGALAQDLDLPQTESADLAEHVPGEILIGFNPWVNSAQARIKLAEHDLQSKRHIPALNAHLVKLPPGLSVEKAIDRYSHLPGVDYAEPNYILQIAAEPPTEIDDQWGLNQIHSVEAWATFSTPVTKEIILATIDTGIDRNQSDLAVNMWENPGEIGTDGNGNDKTTNGIDDDANGFVDDWWGWDFVNNDNDPLDDNMHGTAVSSVMAGNHNGQGVAGVCPWCKVMSVKVMGANGSGTLDVVASGITYAADNEAQVINLSLTGSVSSSTLENAVNYAWVQGALVVAAAGNNGLNTTMYPAGYDNAMGVGSTNASDQRSCFSNFAENYISVAAPGEAILVADINNTETGYGYYSGTSLSAPHVVGLAGLLLSQDPAPDNNLLRSQIENTAVDLGQSGFDPVFGHGRIDAYRAVTNDQSQGQLPEDLYSTNNTASGYAHARKLVRDGNGVLHVIWHTQEGPNYQIKYAISSDNGDSWVLKQDVLSTEDEAYHPALAMDDQNLYVAIPSRNTPDAKYEILFSWKPLSEGAWSQPVSIMGGGNYDTVRPDIFVDPSNGRLHLVASSLDNAPYIYYLASGDQGSSWDGQVAEVNPSTGTVGENSNTRYASIHANGKNIYIVSRTVSGYFLVTYYMHTVRSTDGGKNWFDRTKISSFLAITSGEYGISIAGVGDRLYMGYEVGSNLYFRYHNGTDWSNYETLELGDANNINKWPSITQAEDGQAWMLFEVNGESFMRHYDGTTWEDKESVGAGTYANFKLGTNGDQLEWIYTSCNGAPFVVKHESRTLGANNPPVAADQTVPTDEDTPVDITLTGSDPDDDLLTYSVVTGPIDGTLSGSAPALTYTPDLDFNGGDSFTFVTNDGKVDSNIAIVTINVNAANDNPVAVGDSYLTDEETTLNVPAPGVLGNDTDVESDPLTAVLDTLPSNGILVLNANGSFTYTPNAYFNGEDTFTYHAIDGLADSNIATVTINVNAANDNPVAVDDSYLTDEETTLNVPAPGVLGNDTDVESDPLTAVLDTLPSSGILVLNANGSFTYTPNAYFNGEDTFTYHANDGLDSNVATVTITVNATNDPPVAMNDTYSTDEDTTLNVAAPGVLDNDTDIENDTLTTVLDEGPDNGALTLNANGSFTYTPNANFNGSDTFTYNANDGLVDSNIATVTITVNATNDQPVAVDDSYSTNEDTKLNVSAPGVLINDTDVENDTLTIVLDEGPDNGALTLNANGSFTYTPNANFNGSDTFTYNANDGLVDSNIATVTITVNATNDQPVAVDDSYSTNEDTKLNVSAPGVLINDTDVENDTLTIVLDEGPDNGALTLNANGSFTYTPNANFYGLDTFTYHANDGTANSNVVTVTIDVNAANDQPVAVDDSYSTNEDTKLNVSAPGVLINDTDVENNTLTAVLDVGPANGTLSLNADGSFTYTPKANFYGSDTFTYHANDGLANSNIATVTIDVNAMNDKPVANDMNETTFEETLVYWQPDVSDVDNDPLTCSILGSATEGGTVTIDPNCGTSSYDPPLSFYGTDSFTYQVCDESQACDTGIVNYTVSAVSMHVQDLDAFSETAPRNRWNALVTVTVQDAMGFPVAAADVSGTWSDGATGGGTCTTDASGSCEVRKNNLKSNINSITFTVDGISHATLTYKPSANDDPDADSDGTKIIVYKDGIPFNQPPVATFSYLCSDLNCDFDASESTDADGSIVSYAWDYGDGNGGSGVLASHPYGSTGLYTVVLTVTDDGGASSTDTQLVNVGGVVQLIHVGDIDGSTSDANRGRWNATATITVHSENHTVLEGATVSATWSTGKVGNCTTNASGECSLTLSNIKSTVDKVIFTVTNVTAPGWEYDSLSNQDPDNDSNGTSIDIDYPPS